MKIYNKEYTQDFGRFIKEGREKLKYSQTDVARQLKITQSYYSYIEAGSRNIDLSLAMEICKILNIDMKDFIKKYM
jgi:transcriptional regulator with XRE-family HTH domain